jgi:hypothetical protein
MLKFTKLPGLLIVGHVTTEGELLERKAERHEEAD